MSKDTELHLSLSAAAARNLATATVTVPQFTEITPRWLHKLLPWVDVDGGVYRVNRVAKAAKGERANEFGEVKVDLLTVDRGEPKLPMTFVDYEIDPREYHLSTIQTVLRTHTRVTDLYSNKIDQLREQIRLTVEAVKEREEWELINHPEFGLLKEVDGSQTIKTRKGSPSPDDLDELLGLVWKKPAVPLDGGVIISTPQEASLGVVRKGIAMFRKVNVPILGIVENMSYFTTPNGERVEIFGHGGGRQEAARQNTPFLGEVPIFTEIREGGDSGMPIMFPRRIMRRQGIHPDRGTLRKNLK
ncbi:MAG: P-loop NTPase [Limisphaerales bacterium]